MQKKKVCSPVFVLDHHDYWEPQQYQQFLDSRSGLDIEENSLASLSVQSRPTIHLPPQILAHQLRLHVRSIHLYPRRLAAELRL